MRTTPCRADFELAENTTSNTARYASRCNTDLRPNTFYDETLPALARYPERWVNIYLCEIPEYFREASLPCPDDATSPLNYVQITLDAECNVQIALNAVWHHGTNEYRYGRTMVI